MKPLTHIMQRQEKAVFSLRSVFDQYGYQQFRMNRFEEYDLYLRNKDFLISDSILTFTDPVGRLMALKPDVTISIVKNFRYQPQMVQRVYYDENVYRVPKGSQTAKEIMQVGLECMGDIDAYCRYEVVSLAVKSLETLDVPYVLSLSHLGFVTRIIERCGFAPSDVRKALQWVEEKNAHELTALAQSYQLPADLRNALLNLVKTYGEVTTAISELEEDFKDWVEEDIWQPFMELLRALSSMQRTGAIWVDFSVMNDIHYYNGIVFQGFVQGIPDVILSGGQYDGLMEKFGKVGSAIGFALYLNLLERLEEQDGRNQVDVMILYDETTDPATVQNKAEELRREGKRVLCVRQEPENILCLERINMKKEETHA